MRLTKIVASISDLRCDIDFIKSLMNAGMNVARINTAHITTESAREIVNNIRRVSNKIAILIDTKGPEIRTVGLENPMSVQKGDLVHISGDAKGACPKCLLVSYDRFQNILVPGNHILIDDGDIELTVVEKGDNLICRVENDGVIKNNKSVNIPGVSIELPSITERDSQFIKFAVENDLDFIAHSFVRDKNDILQVQEILNRYNSQIKIIAKIENLDGINNIDEILDHAYGIMIARGDLGIEVPAEKLPSIQRNLIKKAVEKKKPVIVATQMLHTMIEHPRPTRAEVNDIANAVFSRADALMLSGETAYGKYPQEAVSTMARIAEETELSYDTRNDAIMPPVANEIPAYLAESAIVASTELPVKLIVATTTTGRTTRYLAAYRGTIPVIAKCHSMRVVREMALSFGIVPSYIEMKKNKFKIEKLAISSLIKSDIVQPEDLIIYVGGRFGEDAGASFIEISTVNKFNAEQ
ncbi:MAG: pyruvate kinase [Prolixibacteraceae bacterium]|nr:pyruvate kinase [Prolixibacteraceae bacterium]